MKQNNKSLPEILAAIRSRLERYTQRSGFRFNTDSDTVEQILAGLASRQQQFGKAYCPCRLLTGNAAVDARIVCPCSFHRAEIARDGVCHCKLFTGPLMDSAPGEKNG